MTIFQETPEFWPEESLGETEYIYTYVCMSESLLLETITTSLMGYAQYKIKVFSKKDTRILRMDQAKGIS